MIEPIQIAGEAAWLKHYDNGGGRRYRLAALDLLARKLGLGPLRPPPHHAGREARDIEQRRILELQEAGVRVPQILGVGDGALVLSDIGPTLASRMREAGDEPARLDALTGEAIAAIGDGHARGAHFGQPWPRNLTFDERGVGFIDFEEDPLEVMPLDDAQARDWVLFAYGTARYYSGRQEVLSGMIGDALAQAPVGVADAAARVGTRLAPLGRFARRLRHRDTRTVARAISVLRAAAPLLLAIAILLGIDLIHDGEIDFFADLLF